MKNFMVSAPGKIILYGEHAVVYGKTAIAAAISLRTYLLVTEATSRDRVVHLQFPDIGLDHEWLIDDLPWSHFTTSSPRFPVRTPEPNDPEALFPHVDMISNGGPHNLQKAQHAAASAFLYLYLSLFTKDSAQSCNYSLRSEIPVGAGLGSSSSMTVCVSTALLLQTENLSLPDSTSQDTGDGKRFAQINHCAFVGEMFIHGNPSGIDNAISSRGGAIRFKRNLFTEQVSIDILETFPEIAILLINTRQHRSTSDEVAKVRSFKAKYPVIVDEILETMGKIAESACVVLKRARAAGCDSDAKEQLGELFRINHALLASLGVSHPKLERIRYLIDHPDIGWTKLTGAGGGGCAIAIARAGTSACRLSILRAQLEAEGFEQYEVGVGGHGVGVLSLTAKSCDFESCNETFHGLRHHQAFRSADTKGLGSTIGDYAKLHGEAWRFWSV